MIGTCVDPRRRKSHKPLIGPRNAAMPLEHGRFFFKNKNIKILLLEPVVLWATADLLAGWGQPLAVVPGLSMGNREAVRQVSGLPDCP